MRLHLERMGGFTGLRLKIDLDSEALSSAEARKLEKLLARSHFFDLPVDLKALSPGADRFQYRLTIEREGLAHTVEATEASLPAELRLLLEYITRPRRA